MTGLGVLPSRLLDPLFLMLVCTAVGLSLTARPALAHGHGWFRRGAWLLFGAWLVLWIASTPIVASYSIRAVEPPPTDLTAALAGVDPNEAVLVVLGGGMRPDELGTPPMERLHGGSITRTIAAARVWKAHRFGRVVVTGESGTPAPGELAQGVTDLLVALGVPRERIELESESKNTRQNAERTMALLRAGTPPRKVVVLSSAVHVPRALEEFRRLGVDAVGAPVDHEGFPRWAVDSLLPSSSALWQMHKVLHELFGRYKP